MGTLTEYEDLLAETEIVQRFTQKGLNHKKWAQQEDQRHIEELKDINTSLKRLRGTKKFYRYRPINENAISALVNDKLFFSLPQHFNDPFDAMPYYDLSKIRAQQIEYEDKKKNPVDELFSQLAQLTATKNPPLVLTWNVMAELQHRQRRNALIDILDKQKYFNDTELVEKLNLNQRDHLHIACLSTSSDNMLMWSHYAQGHEGFVLEYDLDDIGLANKYTSYSGNSCPPISLSLFPIIYQQDAYDNTDRLIAEIELKAQEMLDGQTLFLSDDLLRPIRLCGYKKPIWSYENEWRLLLQDFGAINNEAYRYIALKPQNVYLGCKISQENQEMIKKICSEKKIHVEKMNFNRNSGIKQYSLKSEPASQDAVI